MFLVNFLCVDRFMEVDRCVSHLVVHDGSQTHDTNVNIIFLTDES